MIFFLSLNTKDDIVKNVDDQTVDNRHWGKGEGSIGTCELKITAFKFLNELSFEG